MKFRAALQLVGKNATAFEVPAGVVAELGKGKRPPVRVTIDGYAFRNTIAVYGGVFMVGVSAQHRQAAHVTSGDELDIEIELDTEPRVVIVPDDFAAALADAPAARAAFDALSYSHQREHVGAIEDAKTAATRQRRIARAVQMLRAR